jgi:parallel beta-helix repeat protein
MKAKMLYIASALLLVFSLASFIVPAGPAMATEDEVWVDDDYTAATPGWGTTHFDNLEDGIGNTSSGGTVHVAPGTYEADDIYIAKALTITGAGAGITIVDGQYDERLFTVDTHTYVISDITLRHGNASVWGGGIWNHMGTLIMINCIISGNIAGTDGGGVYNEGGEVTLTSCTITGNNADDHGGGIYNYDKLTMTGCTISGNEADEGGGIYNAVGVVTLTNCTINDNTARTGDGGGIYNTDSGDATLINCTISGNTAGGDGGGIFNSYPSFLSLKNCTVTGNDAADQGGGICNNYMAMTMKCTIVFDNTASSDQNIYCLCSIPTYENIVDSPDPLLGPLQNNGGTTETHALLTGSPAIDACTTDCPLPATDQRGLPRPMDGDLDGIAYCDVGAYEKQPPVGGTIEPVDRLELLAPWLALAAFFTIATIAVLSAMKRRHVA